MQFIRREGREDLHKLFDHGTESQEDYVSSNESDRETRCEDTSCESEYIECEFRTLGVMDIERRETERKVGEEDEAKHRVEN